MNIFISQLYPEPGVSFPFTQYFQTKLTERVGRLIGNSADFEQKIGTDYNLIIRFSARSNLDHPIQAGPTIFKRDRDVEYSIFMPKNSAEINFENVISQFLKELSAILSRWGFNVCELDASAAAIARELAFDTRCIRKV